MVGEKEIGVEIQEHDRWLSFLERAFNEKGFTTIREGKMFLRGAGWKEPDLFVLHENQLLLVLEVVAAPSYRDTLSKVRKISRRYQPKKVVVFEPIGYMDKKFLAERKEHYKRNYLDRYPISFREVENCCIEKWKKEYGVEVLFWNENTYEKNIEKLVDLFA